MIRNQVITLSEEGLQRAFLVFEYTFFLQPGMHAEPFSVDSATRLREKRNTLHMPEHHCTLNDDEPSMPSNRLCR